jgi:hypothetical protein
VRTVFENSTARAIAGPSDRTIALRFDLAFGQGISKPVEIEVTRRCTRGPASDSTLF